MNANIFSDPSCIPKQRLEEFPPRYSPLFRLVVVVVHFLTPCSHQGGPMEGFHRFFVTNTIPEVANQVEGKDPFVVIHVDSLLADDILTTLKRK